LHWDGKKAQEWGKSVERLPIKISGDGKYLLLEIPKIPDGKAVTIAEHVVGGGFQDQAVDKCMMTMSHSRPHIVCPASGHLLPSLSTR
jgi:hypothetical protein